MGDLGKHPCPAGGRLGRPARPSFSAADSGGTAAPNSPKTPWRRRPTTSWSATASTAPRTSPSIGPAQLLRVHRPISFGAVLKDGKLACYKTGQLMCFRHPETNVLDSLAQSCGLSLPTLITERIGIMPRIACCIAPFHLGTGVSSASLLWPSLAGGRQQTPVDGVTRSCGLSRPTPFERIRTASAPMNTTPIRIGSGPAERLDNRIVVRGAKSFSRPVARSPCRRGSVRARAGPVC